MAIQPFRRELENAVEFITIMLFDSIDSVRTFAGADYEVDVIPPKARALLSRFDERSNNIKSEKDLLANDVP